MKNKEQIVEAIANKMKEIVTICKDNNIDYLDLAYLGKRGSIMFFNDHPHDHPDHIEYWSKVND